MISVLIVDAHDIIREGIHLLLDLDKEINVVGEGENGKAAITLAQKLKPDIIIMDIAMPLLGGIEATRVIAKESPESKVIILSIYSDKEYVSNAMEAGANGFLVKKTASKNLLKAVHDVNSGKPFFSPIIQKQVLDG